MPVLPSLYERAEEWHREHTRCACSSTAGGGYPCKHCRREIGELLEVLDKVASDAILATMHATARFMS